MRNALLVFVVVLAGSSFACAAQTAPETGADQPAASDNTNEAAFSENADVGDGEPANEDEELAKVGSAPRTKLQACLDGCSKTGCLQQCVEDFAEAEPHPETRAGDTLACCVNKQLTICTARIDGQVCGDTSSPGVRCRHDASMDALCN